MAPAATSRVEPVLEADAGVYGFFVESVVLAALDSGAIDRPQADRWLNEQANRAAEGRFFFAMPLFVGIRRAGS